MNQVPELTIKRTRGVLLARALAMVAVIAVSVAVSIVVAYIGTDRDGWRDVARQVSAENAELRERLESTNDELACRSSAAAVESAAVGELTIHIGETAEAALRIANREEVTPAEIAALADTLHSSSVSVREATEARTLALQSCAAPPTPTGD